MRVPALPFLTLEEACDAIIQGKLVLFPTETFYGLGCDAMNPDAVARVFSVKKRALSLPLPVIIGAREKLAAVASHIPPLAETLMDAFWPGPLSIVMPAHPEVPDLLLAHAGRIAVRCSPHPAALHLCKATDTALVASSANLSGDLPVSRVEDIDPALWGHSAGICAVGPEPAGGLPSTVVVLVRERKKSVIRVLRQGAISVQALEDAGFRVSDANSQS
jgi:L-threonylcarbamoyladenylate synthase